MKILFFVAFMVFYLWTGEDYNEYNSSNKASNVESEKIYKWIKDNRPNRFLKTLISVVKHDRTLLCPQRVDLKSLEEAIENLKQSSTEEKRDRVEELADKLLFKYIYIRNNGCYSPKSFFDEKQLAFPQKKYNSKIIINPIETRLEKALNRYYQIAKKGGWNKIEVSDEIYLRPGKSYPEIPLLKERLKQEGFYTYPLDKNTTYDDRLVSAVIEFQKRHNLKSDGIIGPSTIDALNIDVDTKIKKILLNIERLRWFKENDPFFVFVNIPGFFLYVYDQNGTMFRSRIVVGRKQRPTPLMRDMISYAVINPYWRAPKTIIKEDILPYLKKGNFELLQKKGIIVAKDYKGEKILDFKDVNWTLYNEENIPYYLLQKPGPKNFLGYLKLIFPNKYDVYLHDTNHRHLFRYNFRALSSGCVRVEKPIELFHLLKNREQNITYRDIFDIIWTQKMQKIGFKNKVPVYLSYNSVYVDDNGDIYFYDDVYGYDKRMMKIFKNKSVAMEGR